MAYNMNKYLAALYSANVQGGVSKTAASNNPTQPSRGWKGVTGALTRQTLPNTPQSGPDSAGQQARQVLRNASTPSKGAPSWAQERHDLSGYAGSSLPPTP